MQDRLLTRKELMERVGRSSAQLYRDIKAGVVPAPARRLGRSPRWAESQISSLMRPVNDPDLPAGLEPFLELAKRLEAALVDAGWQALSVHFHRLMVTLRSPRPGSAGRVADLLNLVMLECKWCGTHAVVVDEEHVELIWPRESGTEPEQMMQIIGRIFPNPDAPSSATVA